MMFDMNMLLSHKQVLTASGDSKNGYDRLLNGDDVHRVMTLVVFFNAVAGSGAITVKLKTSADGETWTDAWVSSSLAAAAGKAVSVPLPSGLKRYIKLNYTLPSTVTSLEVTGGITDNEEVACAYENVQKRDASTGEIPDLAAETDDLNAAETDNSTADE